MKYLQIVIWVMMFNIVLSSIAVLGIIPNPVKPYEAIKIGSDDFTIDGQGGAEWADNSSLLYKVQSFNEDASYLKKGTESVTSVTSINDFITAIWLTIDIFSKGTISMQSTYRKVFNGMTQASVVNLNYYSRESQRIQACYEYSGGSGTWDGSSYDGTWSYSASTGDCTYVNRTADRLIWFITIPIQLLYLLAFAQLLSGRNFASLQ